MQFVTSNDDSTASTLLLNKNILVIGDIPLLVSMLAFTSNSTSTGTSKYCPLSLSFSRIGSVVSKKIRVNITA